MQWRCSSFHGKYDTAAAVPVFDSNSYAVQDECPFPSVALGNIT